MGWGMENEGGREEENLGGGEDVEERYGSRVGRIPHISTCTRDLQTKSTKRCENRYGKNTSLQRTLSIYLSCSKSLSIVLRYPDRSSSTILEGKTPYTLFDPPHSGFIHASKASE